MTLKPGTVPSPSRLGEPCSHHAGHPPGDVSLSTRPTISSRVGSNFKMQPEQIRAGPWCGRVASNLHQALGRDLILRRKTGRGGPQRPSRAWAETESAFSRVPSRLRRGARSGRRMLRGECPRPGARSRLSVRGRGGGPQELPRESLSTSPSTGSKGREGWWQFGPWLPSHSSGSSFSGRILGLTFRAVPREGQGRQGRGCRGPRLAVPSPGGAFRCLWCCCSALLGAACV